jgi:hypothetical protein
MTPPLPHHLANQSELMFGNTFFYNYTVSRNRNGGKCHPKIYTTSPKRYNLINSAAFYCSEWNYYYCYVLRHVVNISRL